VASLSQGRTAAAQCGLFTYKSVPVIFEPPCILDPDDYSNFFVRNASIHVPNYTATYNTFYLHKNYKLKACDIE